MLPLAAHHFLRHAVLDLQAQGQKNINARHESINVGINLTQHDTTAMHCAGRPAKRVQQKE